MADTKISALSSATTPLAGTEVVPIVQSGATVKVSVTDLRGSGGGSGTVNSGTQYQLGYYASTGTAISGNSNIKTDANSNLNLAATGATLNSANTFGFKNRIINGGMTIDQRNVGASVSISGSSNLYCTDRWNGFNGSDGVFTLQQVSDAPTGYINSLKFTTTTTDTSLGTSQFVGVRQMIEGFNTSDLNFGTSNAQSLTLSFWVKSSLTGTFGGALLNSAENRSYPFSYTISSSNWEQKTVTITGDTTGTWLTNNGIGFRLVFGLGVGTAYSNTANVWTSTSYTYSVTGAVSVIGTASATWQVTGVQLEVGTQATSFDYRDFGSELMLCQRYYQKSYSTDVVPGTAANYAGFESLQGSTGGDTATGVNIRFKVSMRTAPTFTYYNAASGASGTWQYSFAGGSGSSTVYLDSAGTNGALPYCYGGTTYTTTRVFGHWAATAEL